MEGLGVNLTLLLALRLVLSLFGTVLTEGLDDEDGEDDVGYYCG